MKVEVKFLEGQKLEATCGKHIIKSDQQISVGGNEEYPEPFEYFMASMPLCAAYFVRTFCNARNIPLEGIKITQEDVHDPENKYKRMIKLNINLPETFPIKYKKALIASTKSCSVKKVIESVPDFEVTTN